MTTKIADVEVPSTISTPKIQKGIKLKLKNCKCNSILRRSFYVKSLKCLLIFSVCRTTDTFSVECVFPFKYEGKSYSSCITDGNGGTEWCATSLYSDGSYWGYGDCQCVDVEQPGNFLDFVLSINTAYIFFRISNNIGWQIFFISL